VRHVFTRHPSGTREGDFDNLVAPFAISKGAERYSDRTNAIALKCHEQAFCACWNGVAQS
jgi:hypothetical protein